MAEPPATPGKPAPASKADAGREDRLAAALRANLRRRKAAKLVSPPRGEQPASEAKT
jgi:hypothetical protein